MSDFTAAIKCLKRNHGYSVQYIRKGSQTFDIKIGKIASIDTTFTIRKAIRIDANINLAQFGAVPKEGGFILTTVNEYIIDNDDIKNYFTTPSTTIDFILDDGQLFKVSAVRRLSDKAAYILACREVPNNE